MAYYDVYDANNEKLKAHPDFKTLGPTKLMNLLLGRALDDEQGGLYEQASTLVKQQDKVNEQVLQRRLGVNYLQAQNLMHYLEEDGIVSKPDGSKYRKVLKHE